MSSVFIVGVGRSGTTSLLRALALSRSVHAELEPMPNLNHESRHAYEGRLGDPYGMLARELAPRIAAGLARRPVYVEKQISLVPFMRHLHELFNCRFVLPVRDGRDVVASLIDWHNQMFPTIYQECAEPAELGAHAREVLARQREPDPFDYSLPRPGRNDPWYGAWPGFSRFEMVSWYWAFVNRRVLQEVGQLPKDRFLIVDYTRPTVETVRRVYDFLEIDAFDAQAVEDLLARRVNSLEDQTGQQRQFPRWQEWTAGQLQRFYDIAFEVMSALGYQGPVRPRPPRFGDWWLEAQIDERWYEDIYRYRESSHAVFRDWCATISDAIPIASVMDVGCGLGCGYRDFFADRCFIGVDLSPHAIAWCRDRDPRENHEYHCCDVIAEQPALRADLVFSHGTVDNVYDIDAFLRALARMTGEVLYVANYRGYFGAMERHRYLWDPKTGVCFNDVSPARCEEVLRAEGFQSVMAFPQASGRTDIPAETVIVATRRPLPEQTLLAGHSLYWAFREYRVKPSRKSAKDVLRQVNESCAYFSTDPRALTNTLRDFERLLKDLACLPNRRLGRLEDLALENGPANTAIRLDIDMDLAAALEMARIAGRQRVPLTFFILHTAAYYGALEQDEFVRNDAAAKWYRALQDHGAEVGLHVDALSLYRQHDIDGAQAVRSELAWLRSQGLRIHGTTGHNAAPVYGAENFEIFAGRDVGGRGFFRRDHAYYPLGLLSEAELELRYEGSCPVRGAAEPDEPALERYLAGLPAGDFIRDPEWFRTYLLDGLYCRWGYDFNIWVLGRNFWVVAGREDGRPLFRFAVPWGEVREFLAALPEDRSAVLTLHPVYFGHREDPGGSPVY